MPTGDLLRAVRNPSARRLSLAIMMAQIAPKRNPCRCGLIESLCSVSEAVHQPADQNRSQLDISRLCQLKAQSVCLATIGFMKPDYRGHRFPPEIISYAVWLYHRFTLSFRDVEDLLAERGIAVSYESIRYWCLKFGPTYARSLRRKQGRLGDIWHVDELFITIRGQLHYLWRAVDQDGD